ncbi:receptor-type tyrosine-protein phosphatase T-like isoform X2 [Coccinella septempunctata]|uniref:receptor-type tyrosine-protein phosphatase T-like isoform X2 n=1 Tax=Coccinella septempunctata TaxID=41139 RepID=UPI001D097286|nr:receptor-type tyrosine-protein phosphatase T-like isoform X2 [Coccinella septempunctata]
MNFFWFVFCIFFLLIPGSKESLSLISSANDDFCVTTDFSAMYYTTSNGKVGTKDIEFFPLTTNFCDFEEAKCVKDYKLDPWELAYSVNHENAPILDLRWERLNNQELPFEKGENLEFLTLLQLYDLNYFKLPISLLAEEVHLLLCDRKDVPKANCYWFALQGWSNKYTAMRRCRSGEITGRYPSGKCFERREEKRHPEDFPLFLSEEKWSHIIIERNEKNLYLKTYNDGKEETIIHFSENDEMFQLQYLIGHRKDEQAYCKIHTNHYMRSTTTSEVVFENWFSRIDKGFCLSILLKTCQYCSTLVSFLDEKSNIMLEKSISTTNDFWVEDKIILNISNSQFMKVKLKTILFEGYTATGHEYWSFDNFRQCVTEEYRITPQSSKQKLSECRLLTNNQVVKRQEATRYKPDNTCSTSSSIGSSCISCNVLKQRNKKTCKKMKICENIGGSNICYCSPGYTGYDCSEVPSKVENIELEESTASYMKIKWQVPEYPKGDIQIYIVKYQKVRRISCKSKGWFKSYEANTTVNIIELNNLEPYSEYKITINAINRLEAGDEAFTYFQTQGLDYFKTEENLNIVSIWIESLQRGASITFQNIQCEKLLGPLNFSVSLQCISEWCLETEVRSEILQSFQGTLNLKGLQPYCTYICDISFCRNGNCKIHGNRTFETKASVPNELKEVIVIATGDAFIWIRWLPPYPPTGRAQSYKIITRCVNCRLNHENIYNPTFPSLKRCSIWPEYYCHKIDDYVYYMYQMSLQIEAANEENYIYKQIAYIPKILVEEVASEEPYNVSVTLNLDNTMEIFWNHPNRTNGILDYFHIRIGIADEPSFNITYQPVKWKLKYNMPITKPVPAATDLSIIIIAVNNKYLGHPAQVDVSSYPPKPDLLDSQIYIANYTKTTISISLNTNRVEYLSPNVKKFLLVLINDHSPETKDSNLEILEKIMNITFEKELRVVSEQDLGKLSWNILNLTIGDGNVIKQSSVLKTNIVNKPLQEARYYTILVVLLNEYKGKYRHTIYNDTTLTQGNPEMTPPPTPKSPEREEKEEKDNSSGGSAAYALLLLLLLIPIIIIGLILKRKNIVLIRPTMSLEKIMDGSTQSNNLSKENEETIPLDIKETAVLPQKPIMKVKPKLSMRKSTGPPNPPTDLYSKPVKMADFEEYVKTSIESGELERQHALFPRGQTQPWKYGSTKVNKPKNRYNNLVAYDHSRVILKKVDGDEYSDYINANYIHGYNMERAYIATQGPKATTLTDFWRMIWQENVKHIVMLANIYEGGKKKVEQYWPNINEELTFQDIVVQYHSMELFANFEYRILHVTRGVETREIEQLHFTTWPDHGVPLYPQSLVPFIRKLLKVPLSSASPVVVHCSAGVGRTGTILLADISLRMAAKQGIVDMLNNLQKLREQRPNMVDNVEQYKLAHLVVLECLMGLRTSVLCDENMDKNVQKLIRDGDYKIQMNYLKETEWQDQAMKSVADFSEDLPSYPEKNRIAEVVPENQGRIFLSRYPHDDEASSYINAVEVDGFRCPGRFFVTQQPMPNTIGDFWRLVTERKINVMISLNEVDPREKTCCKFWPTADDDELQPVDFISVKFGKVTELEYYDIYSVHVWIKNKRQKEKFDVEIVSFKRWPAKCKLPPSCEELLSFYEEADAISRRSTNVIVTCFDGFTASGVYVALSFIIEQMKLEHECDVCLAVRTVRHNRKQFVTDESQFLFLYECAVKFINGFQSYANFQNQ